MLDKYKISDAQKNAITSVIERVNRENIYSDFVASQEKGFLRFLECINTEIYILQQKAFVSSFLEIRARIKDIESALANYEKEKMLDDVFGIEIICATEQEIDLIKSKLEEIFSSTKSKEYGPHNRTNGYKAKHESYFAKNDTDETKKWKLTDSDVPIVECQFKTIEVELTPQASHNEYKKVDEDKTQKVLEKNVLEIGKQIPKMWISREGRIRKLTYKETIQRIYPFVDITSIKEPETKNKE